MVVFKIKPEMQVHIDNIFFGLLGGDDAVQKSDRKDALCANICLNIFPDIYAILYSLVCQNCVSSVDDITGMLEASQALIMTSENMDRARISEGLPLTEDEYFQLVVTNTQEAYARYRSQEVPEAVFTGSLEVYKTWYMQEFYRYILSICGEINSKGAFVQDWRRRKVRLSGQADAQRYYSEQTALLEKLERGEQISSTIIDEEWLSSVDTMFKGSEAIMTSGISVIDEYFAFRRGYMLGVAAPPKGGKSRISAYLAARALKAGLNVCVWPLEQSKDEWIAMIVASMIAMDADLSKNLQSNITDDYILSGRFRNARAGYVDRVTPILAQLGTHHDNNGNKIGTLSFIEETCYAETFLKRLESHMTRCQYDVLVIDQLVNILSQGGMFGSKSERISESYMVLKDFIRNKHKIFAVMPCQVKQEVIKRLRDKPDEDMDVTAGGESAETIRTPDYVLGIFATPEEKRNMKCKMYCVATRHSRSFETFEAHADYGACFFSDDNSTAGAIQAPTV